MIIYKLINLINNKIYIGQHNGKRKSSYFGSGELLLQALKKYGKENFLKEILIDEDYNQEFIDYLEKHYIRLYASTFRDRGYNIQSGGRGINISIITDSFREHVRKRMLGNTIMNGRKHSKETNEKRSKTTIERLQHISKDELRRRSLIGVETRREKYDIGKLISQGRQLNKKLDWDNKQTKPIIQETKSGEFIKLWASAYQAHKEDGYLSSNISGVCYKKYGQKSYKGFNWRFATDKDTILYKNECQGAQ